jgi:hypothetical protein
VRHELPARGGARHGAAGLHAPISLALCPLAVVLGEVERRRARRRDEERTWMGRMGSVLGLVVTLPCAAALALWCTVYVLVRLG